jgi:hypothetical protein
MELPIEFQNKANALESKWANTPHKYEGIQQADGYEQGALDMLKAVEAMLKESLHIEKININFDIFNKAEQDKTGGKIEAISYLLTNLQSIKPL